MPEHDAPISPPVPAATPAALSALASASAARHCAAAAGLMLSSRRCSLPGALTGLCVDACKAEGDLYDYSQCRDEAFCQRIPNLPAG